MRKIVVVLAVILAGSVVANAAEEGKVSFGTGLDVALMSYSDTAVAGSNTAVIGADFFALGIRLAGEYGISSMISSGVEIVPWIELKEAQDLESMDFVFYGKSQAGPGYGKIGLVLSYNKAASDMDVGINLGFGITREISPNAELEVGVEITPFFRLANLILPIALRLGVNFGL